MFASDTRLRSIRISHANISATGKKRQGRYARSDAAPDSNEGGHVTAGRPSGIETRDWFERDVTRSALTFRAFKTFISYDECFIHELLPIACRVEYRFYNLPSLNKSRAGTKETKSRPIIENNLRTASANLKFVY